MNLDLAARYEEVRKHVAEALERSGRSQDVTVVAVSKTFPADVVLAAIDAGITELGESRAQELKEKYAVAGDRARWHFIGHLQTNKVRNVVGIARLIHSVDRYGLAEAIARRARGLGLVQDVLIEINIARDPNRHGVDPAQAASLAEEVDALDGVAVRGVMGMAPFLDDPAETRPFFQELARLGAGVAEVVPGATELSMGMTRDYVVAVEEGATIVRVGEAVFGPRHR